MIIKVVGSVAFLYYITKKRIDVIFKIKCHKLRNVLLSQYSLIKADFECVFVVVFLRRTNTVNILRRLSSFNGGWRKTTGAPPCIISSTTGHLSRTIDVTFSWIANQKSLAGFEPTTVRDK